MLNKRGQGLQVSTIILMVLGVVVLILLALGFALGFEKILPWLSVSNVDTVVNQCQSACGINSVYGFCTQNRTLKADDLPQVNGKTVKEISGTCNYFATTGSFSPYSITDCPGLCT
jgi:hypothetical protein